jgi:hypothetical protein
MTDKLLFINENNQFMFRRNIVEYDMQSASLAVSQRFGLLDPVTIEQLKNTPKIDRVKKVGLMQRDNEEFSNKMIQGIIDTRQEFLDINHIKEDDILCLHSDAVIFDMKSDIIDKIDNVEFIKKQQWSSYILYQGVEIYYGDGVITYKGIPKDILRMHTLGLNKYLLKVFSMMEECNPEIIPYLNKFQKKYLMDRLPDYFYTSFPKVGAYKLANLKLFGFIANVVMSDMRRW